MDLLQALVLGTGHSYRAKRNLQRDELKMARGRQLVFPCDERAQADVAALKEKFYDLRMEIMRHTQFKRNYSCSPSDSDWGKPHPIDINGLIERVY